MHYVHRLLLKWAYTTGISPLVASIAGSLIVNGDDNICVLVCWWIAIKFETGNCKQIHLLANEALGMSVSNVEMVLREADVLTRINFKIPYRTTIRYLYEALDIKEGKNTQSVVWLFMIMFMGVEDAHSIGRWTTIIKEHETYEVDTHNCAIRTCISESHVDPPKKMFHDMDRFLVFTPTKKRKRSVYGTILSTPQK